MLTQTLTGSYEFGRALSKRIKRWRTLTEHSISQLGISPGEFGVLIALSESGPQLMVDLAKNQALTQAAITGIVDSLESLGLAQREPSKTDRRKVRVAITEKGEGEVRKGIRLYKKFIEKATRHMGAREMSTVLELLDVMIATVEKDM